ncbi:hypothetical protein PVK06_029248 [Gossypium arboreum]|uniref:MULE transposase domain-containing protein n=1 Tax=Gossypium arboreum TaxID=29729 RepID=A0ABR0P644_GOSAR|nr:hypothetical protein PVK06_029248 [Gossypium arboreum]
MATSPFFTDQVFESREELMQWVQNMAFSLGYIIVTRRTKAKENGVVSYVTLICDRGSEYKFKESSSYLKQYDGWTLRVICDQHNHQPAQHMDGHAYARRLKENENKLLVDLTSKNVTPRDILSTLKEQDENNVSTLKTICNARQKLRSSQNVCKTLIQIVGVTSTNKTFSIAFAFIINKKEENYNWALTYLKLKLEECMYLHVIVTDRELALMNTCQQVFPDATRLLYRWHIIENIKKHYRQSIKSQHEWDSFCAMWIVLVESPTWILYTENYRKLQPMLSKYPGECIPLDSIDVFWRKLDLSPSTSVENKDICCDDLNQMLESCDTHPLMKEIPDMFHPYITHVQYVRGDGNCRFRSISVCLGYGEDQWLYVRHQLLDELLSSYDVYARVFTDGIDELRNSLCFSQSPAPAEHWMVMPITGALIANRFGVILNYLTK